VLRIHQVPYIGDVVLLEPFERSSRTDQLLDGGSLNARVKMMPALDPATELYVNLNANHWV
jgi:hypothetical protein